MYIADVLDHLIDVINYKSFCPIADLYYRTTQLPGDKKQSTYTIIRYQWDGAEHLKYI